MAEYDETEYAEKVVEWLERRDWTVYKEVEGPRTDRIVDIYAIKGGKSDPRRSHAVEVKTGFSFKVVEQAHHWRRHANFTSIAVPEAQPRRARKFGQRVCAEFGIGIFEVVHGDHGPIFARQKKRPKHRSIRNKHVPQLYEEQKWSVAGTPDDEERWTQFDHTKMALKELVEEHHPHPIDLNDAVSEIDHHYKNDDSAVATLKRSIPDRAVPNVKLTWRDKVPLLSLRED